MVHPINTSKRTPMPRTQEEDTRAHCSSGSRRGNYTVVITPNAPFATAKQSALDQSTGIKLWGRQGGRGPLASFSGPQLHLLLVLDLDVSIFLGFDVVVVVTMCAELAFLGKEHTVQHRELLARSSGGQCGVANEGLGRTLVTTRIVVHKVVAHCNLGGDEGTRRGGWRGAAL